MTTDNTSNGAEVLVRASRVRNLYFPIRGSITLLDLWHIDLSELNAFAEQADATLRQSSGAGFLSKPNKEQQRLQLMYDVAMFIGRTRKAEEEAKALRAQRQAQRKLDAQAVAQAMFEKRAAARQELSLEELQQLAAELAQEDEEDADLAAV